jgi:hypothetical protein
LECNQPTGFEPGVRPLQLHKTLNEQACANQKNRRESQLGGSESASKNGAHATGRTAAGLLQDIGQIRIRDAPGGSDAEEQPGDNRKNEREQQRRRIDLDFSYRKQVRRQRAIDQTHRPECQSDAGNAATPAAFGGSPPV